MQSNIDAVVDDLNEFPDSWVELYNDGDETVDLFKWYISNVEDRTKGWKITSSLTIPSKSYVLVYCDNAAQRLHTNFKLESRENGSIYLFNSFGKKVDEVVGIARQPAPNVACGRIQDGGSKWSYFIKPTPRLSNNVVDNMATNVAPAPVFNQNGGVFKNPVTLKLALPDGSPVEISSNQIYYTTNGSEPVPGVSGTSVYLGALTISKPTVVRAKTIAPGFLIGRSLTQTYIVDSRDFSLPIVSISLNEAYLKDPDFGIYVNGSGKNGIAGNCTSTKVNWNQDWRRPMNIEYFPSQNNTSVFNQLGEMRISGGCSRGNAQKSLIVYADKRFGEKKFDYQLFNEKPNQEIKSFILRNSGNDFYSTHIRDAVIQLFMGGKVDIDYQAYQPSIIYINGVYYGIQNIRERSDEDFVVANYNGLEDIDMYEVSASGTKLQAGDINAYKTMYQRIILPTEQLTYEELAAFVDVPEFINYNILQIYIANTDYPNNNVVFWRPRTPDGKWRYILKDTDFGLSLLMHKSLAYNTEERTETLLFRRLLDKAPFKEEFINRFAIYMGDILGKESTEQVIDSIKQIVQQEMPLHRELYNLGGNWEPNVDNMKTWCAQRNTYVYSELNSYFKLKGAIPMTLSIPTGISGTSSVSINNVPLRKHAFDGKYFKGRQVHIKWDGDEFSPFSGWKVSTTILGKETSTEIYGKEIDYQISDVCSKVDFVAVTTISDVEKAETSNIKLSIDYGSVLISNLEGSSIIVIYDVLGHLISRTRTGDSSVSIPIETSGVLIIQITTQNKTITRKVVKY